MIGVEAAGLFHQGTAALPVAGKRNLKTHVGEGEAIHGIEFHGPLRGAAKGLRFAPEVQDRRQGVMRQVIGGGGVNRAPRRGQGASQRVGAKVEAVVVFFAVQHGQHGQAIGIAGGLLDGLLQRRPRARVVGHIDMLEVGKAAQQSFVGGQLVRVSVAQRLAHAVGENAVGFRYGGDDAGDEFVLEFENGFGVEGAIVGFGPQVGAGSRIDELHGEAQPRFRPGGGCPP